MPASKDIYKPTDWKAYNDSLCLRGSLTLWLEDSVYREWRDLSTRGISVGEKHYPDIVILTCLTLKQVYGLKFRQCTGFVRSLFALMGLGKLPIPNYSTLSRRSGGISVPFAPAKSGEPLHIAVDSTGLKVFGEGEWKVRKHGASKRRTWRKLHLGIDTSTQQIVSCILTENSVDDAEVGKQIAEGLGGQLGDFHGDGAYDRGKCREAVRNSGGRSVVPPRRDAKKSKGDKPWKKERDKDIERIEQVGRKEWKIENGYHRRSLSEVAMYRYKTILGGSLNARKFESQVTEVKVGAHILNTFNRCGMPNSVKI